MSKNRTSRFMPVIVAVSIVTGILIGTFYANHFSGNKLGIINTSSNKLNALLRIIDDQYVDTVNMGELVEDAMPQILGELDPHSSYIPAKDLEAVNSDLKGSFSGIGIQFTIQQDTIHPNFRQQEAYLFFPKLPKSLDYHAGKHVPHKNISLIPEHRV